MLKPCKYSDCAVCHKIENRDFFKSILKILHPEVYICEHAIYKITSANGQEIILSSLDYILKGRVEYFIRDIYTGDIIYLNKNNFQVMCSTEKCGVTEKYVAEYKIP